MSSRRPLRIPLVLTFTALSAGAQLVTTACSSTPVTTTDAGADAAGDAVAQDSTLPPGVVFICETETDAGPVITSFPDAEACPDGEIPGYLTA
jgi:hypothetical protein